MERKNQLGLIAALTVIASVMVLSLGIVLFDRGRASAAYHRYQRDASERSSNTLQMLDDAADQYDKDRKAGKFKLSDEDARRNPKMDLTPRMKPNLKDQSGVP